MVFLVPLIILQIECASQKKQTYEITNSMRSTAQQPVLQISPSPTIPVYAKDTPPAVPSYQDAQAPVATIPVETSPSAELKINTKKNTSKGSIEPEGSQEKEKDAAITNGKGGGEGEGGGGGGRGRGGGHNIGVGVDEKRGKGDDEFDECPDLTPDILKNIVIDSC